MPGSFTRGDQKGFSPGQPLRSSDLNALAAAAQQARARPGPGAFGVSLPGGSIVIPFAQRGGSAAAARPVPLSPVVTSHDDHTYVRLYPGTINGIIPSNLFVDLEVPEGPQYVVLECTASAGTVTSVTVAVTTAAPDPVVATPGSPPTAWSIPATLFDAEHVAYDLLGGSLSVTPVEAFRAAKEAPAIGEFPFDVWYTWTWLAG